MPNTQVSFPSYMDVIQVLNAASVLWVAEAIRCSGVFGCALDGRQVERRLEESR